MEASFLVLFLVQTLASEIGHAQRLTVPDPSANRYLTYYFYGCNPNEKIYCREGARGPCGENQVAVDPNGFSGYQFPQLDCEFSGNADCTTELADSAEYSNKIGICIWSDPDHPCYGSPATHRLYPEDGKCYPVQEPDPSQCKHKQIFYSVDDFTGDCDCELDDTEATAYIYWSDTDECYPMNSQGPCSSGEWLVLDSSGNGSCVKTPCPADGKHVLYSNGKEDPRCYELYTNEPCMSEGLAGNREKEISYYVPEEVLERVQLFPEKLECVYPRISPISIAQALMADRGCRPGSKLSISGKCKQIYK